MRILLDECVDQALRHAFSDHDCQTARFAGLGGLKNGALLAAAEAAHFAVLLTVDRGIEHQQNLRSRQISIIVMRGKSDRLRDLFPLVPQCLVALASIRPGQLITIEEAV